MNVSQTPKLPARSHKMSAVSLIAFFRFVLRGVRFAIFRGSPRMLGPNTQKPCQIGHPIAIYLHRSSTQVCLLPDG